VANRRERDQTIEWLAEIEADVWDSLASTSIVLIRTQVTGGQLDLILEAETVRVVDLPPAMRLDRSEAEVGVRDLQIRAPQENAPVIAVLDSGIVAGHPVIGPALADAQSFVVGTNEIDETGHGTAVGAFAIYGDVEECVRNRHFEPALRLLSGKVLSGQDDEYDRRLIENQIIDAVDYFSGEAGCRIFNLSFGDRERVYDGRHVRGLAALIDELVRERNIVFVVSAGNFMGTDAGPENWRDEYPGYLFEPEAKLLDPAPALNALTVGSLAKYDLDTHAERYPLDPSYQPIARANQLSPFTRTGPGPNGSIKPDVVEYGGNVSIDIRAGGAPRFNAQDSNISELAAKHDFVGARLFTSVVGTSYAAPKVTNLAGKFLAEYPDASANLIRAAILLNSEWPDGAMESLQDVGDESEKSTYFSFGYGRPRSFRTLFSSENCVSLLTEQLIGPDQTHFFEIPLPDDFLYRGKSYREIRVALAHSPRCKSTRKNYKSSRIAFKIVAEKNIDSLASRFRENSELENVPEWGGFEPGSQLRNKGSAMAARASIAVLSSASALLKGKKLFAVVTRQVEPWADVADDDQEAYALTVAIEEFDREDVRMYAQLRARLRARARIRR
jgi:hypothetical protein